jgi:hypothetical protein
MAIAQPALSLRCWQKYNPFKPSDKNALTYWADTNVFNSNKIQPAKINRPNR